MNMQDLKQLEHEYNKAIDNRNSAAYRACGALVSLVKDIKEIADSLEMAKKFAETAEQVLKEYNEADLALECASRDYFDCLEREAQIATLPEA